MDRLCNLIVEIYDFSMNAMYKTFLISAAFTMMIIFFPVFILFSSVVLYLLFILQIGYILHHELNNKELKGEQLSTTMKVVSVFYFFISLPIIIPYTLYHICKDKVPIRKHRYISEYEEQNKFIVE